MKTDNGLKEFLETYGEVYLEFSSYYKYSFTFSKVLDTGEVIVIDVGGSSDEIYELEIVNNDKATVRNLIENYPSRYVVMYNSQKEVIFSEDVEYYEVEN